MCAYTQLIHNSLLTSLIHLHYTVKVFILIQSIQSLMNVDDFDHFEWKSVQNREMITTKN